MYLLLLMYTFLGGLAHAAYLVFNDECYPANHINLHPSDLARHAPEEWSPEEALEEAEGVILAYLRIHFRERYEEAMERKRGEIREFLTCMVKWGWNWN